MSNNSILVSQLCSLTGIKRPTLTARTKSIFEDNELDRGGNNRFLLKPHQTRAILGDYLLPVKGKIIYVGNLKGGVGKSALTYLIANAISTLGLKTCAIDLDVQANLTDMYSVIDLDQPVFHDVIDGKFKINDVVIKISDTLDLLPSSLKNSLIEKSLTMQGSKHHLNWFNSLALDYLREEYDVIIVDTPPALTTLNSVFCLCLNETDQICIPACPDNFSLLGIKMFLEDVIAIRESYKLDFTPKISIILNKFFTNQKNNLEMLLKVEQEWRGMVSGIVIKEASKIREIINSKIPLGKIKNGKEIFETISNLLREFGLLKKDN